MQAALDFQEGLSEKQKITLILLYLSTQACNGISGRLADLRKKEGATENEAWTILDNWFEDLDAARSKLNSLKQRGEAYEAYVQDFSNLLLEARGREWPEEIKINAFRKGLDSRILNHTLVMAPGRTLEDEIKTYRQVYTSPQRNQNLDKLSAGTSGSIENRQDHVQYRGPMGIDSNFMRPNPTPRPSRQQNLGPGLPDDHRYRGRVAKWVSREDMAKRRQANVCLRCARPGCYVRVCPLKPARNPNHTTTQIDNTKTQKWVTPPVEETSVAEEQGKA
ncbi:Retrotransposon gag protein [Ceratocystis lukuohia]|uniref:Retrotransposon gag protein n=1 Tax=Ceratocystis lukuohia TaxID=2019550 RepID=A0ABR4MGH3_9PEZI